MKQATPGGLYLSGVACLVLTPALLAVRVDKEINAFSPPGNQRKA
jgi:hypothetical protein